MFGTGKRKSAKELEKELEMNYILLAEYRKHQQKVERERTDAAESLVILEQEQKGLEKALAKAMDYVKQIQEEESAKSEKEKEFADQIARLSEELAESEAVYQECVTAVNGQQEQFLHIVDQNKRFNGPAKFLGHVAKDMEQETGQMEQKLSEMESYGKQMGVLALNAAIEAGRMGESGRKFVSAAEEVRGYASSYQETAQDLEGQVAAIKQQLAAAQEQIELLTNLLEENTEAMQKAKEGFGACRDSMEDERLFRHKGTAQKLSEEFQSIAAMTGEHEAYFGNAFESIEQVGNFFMKEQQTIEELKEQWKRLDFYLPTEKQTSTV